jgi:LPXTG-motif cell wall-anchored protein
MRSDLLGRVAAGVAGVGLALALAAPAAAEEEPVSLGLDDNHAGTVAADHQQRCAEGTDETDPRMADLGEDEAGWHLQVNDGEINSMTVIFAPEGADSDERAEFTGTRGEDAGDADNPVIFGETGAYVFAPADWVLVTATVEVVEGDDLVVAYTCAPAPDDASTEDGTDDGDTGDAAGEGGEGGEGGLPVTGAQVGGMLVIGFGLLSAGFAMTAVRRRRDLSHLLGS